MIEYLTVDDVQLFHADLIATSGGSSGLRDRGALESAVAQPMMTFDGQDLYESLAEKAAAMAFSLIVNHPFVDGNKRVGHAAMASFLLLNGHKIEAPIDEQELTILAVAAGQMKRDEFTAWVQRHSNPCQPDK